MDIINIDSIDDYIKKCDSKLNYRYFCDRCDRIVNRNIDYYLDIINNEIFCHKCIDFIIQEQVRPTLVIDFNRVNGTIIKASFSKIRKILSRKEK